MIILDVIDPPLEAIAATLEMVLRDLDTIGESRIAAIVDHARAMIVQRHLDRALIRGGLSGAGSQPSIDRR
jgi:hypothetical protein